jgi:hypothetical protein
VDDEPVPRQSKLNFRQDEMIAGLQLCNLRRNLEFTKQRPNIAPAEATRVRARIHKTRRGALMGELRTAVNIWNNGYRFGHGMIGTVLIAFDGDPLMIFVLIAR